MNEVLRSLKTSDLRLLAQALTLDLLIRQANHAREPLSAQHLAELIELSDELRRRIKGSPSQITPETEALIRDMRERRRAEGLSIRALADAIQVSFATLARLERGDGNPSPSVRTKIISWLQKG